MIQQIQSDTARPSNYLDSDFGPDTQELPPARPIVEMSPVSYSIVKADLAKVFAKACDMSHSVEPPEYEVVMEQDRLLQKIYQDTPPALRTRSMYQSLLDPPSMIMFRFKLEFLFQKARCVLHRRYLTDACVGTPMEQSRKLCVEAAMKILTHHEMISQAADQGGPLSKVRFYLSSLNAHDFLLAAMILCMELDLISKATSPATAGPNLDKTEEIRKLIETSYKIYKSPVRRFRDTEKAVRAMEVILKKLGPAGTVFLYSDVCSRADTCHRPSECKDCCLFAKWHGRSGHQRHQRHQAQW
jgi:hypothetical protein